MLEPALRMVTYALLALCAATAALILGRDPLTTRSLLGLEGPFAAATSIAMGALLAGATIAASRAVVRASAWGRALHADLRPAVRHASGSGIVVVALASGVVEELVFRGLLVPLVGALLSSVAFGLLHQIRGRARWAWTAWATLTGLLLAGIFTLTGSLAGPIVAHVLINLVNLRHLRDTDVPEDGRDGTGRSSAVLRRARLGGILGLSARDGTAPPTASGRAPVGPSARRA